MIGLNSSYFGILGHTLFRGINLASPSNLISINVKGCHKLQSKSNLVVEVIQLSEIPSNVRALFLDKHF